MLKRFSYRLLRSENKKQAALKPSGPAWIQIASGPLTGNHLLIDPQVKICEEMIRGECEPFIQETLTHLGPLDGKTIWDVGGFAGYHTMLFAKFVGRAGHVVTFEPNPRNAERIMQHLSRNPELADQVTIVKKALSNQDGEAIFVLSPDVDNTLSSGSHLEAALAPEEPAVYAQFERTIVETVKADTLLLRGGVPSPFLVKVDVEGAEHLVLQGAREMLRNTRPIWLIEVHNILAMFSVQELLYSFNYDIRMLHYEHQAPMRCFIMAIPS